MTIVLMLCALWLPNPPELDEGNLLEPSQDHNSDVISQSSIRGSALAVAAPPDGFLPIQTDNTSTDNMPVVQTNHSKFFSSEEKDRFDKWITRDDTWRAVPENLRGNH